MRLPALDYGGTIERSSQVVGAPYEAAAGLSKAVADGLAAYSMELIKTQQQEAGLRVKEGLQAAENVIKSRPYVSAQEIRDTLGDQIPDHIRQRLTDAEGKDVEQIPTAFVAGALYDHQARKLVGEAAKSIDGQGWQTHFKENIGAFVLDRQQTMAQYQLQALDGYLQQTQRQQVERAINARDFEGALGLLHGTPEQPAALPPAERQKWRDAVESARQEAPALDALSSTKFAEIQAQANRLRTDKAAMAAIPEDKRRTLVHALDTRAATFEAQGIADEAFLAGTTPGSRVLDETAALRHLDGRLAGKSPEVRKDARAYFKAALADFNEDRKNETARVFAVALQAFNAPGGSQFKTAAVPPDAKAYLTDPSNGKEAADLWSSLLDKERSEETRGRTLAAQPTEANWKAYGALVKDMADFPSKYRGMSGDRFTAEVYGQVGPLIDKAMTAYKSAVEPVADKRVITGGERKSLLEALPPEYRPSRVTKPDSVQAQVWDLMMQRIGDRKAREWEDSKGEVPDAVLKGWVEEEWAKGTVKGGRFWGLLNKTGVPKPVAEVAFPGKEFVPDKPATAGPAPAPAGGSVVVEYQGKRLRIPRSKLAEALKDGAKEVP